MKARDRVILKSIELFTKAGIRQVTMDQIASAVGMSKRTIYELFKDKYELLLQCIQTISNQHKKELDEIISNSDNAIEALYLMGQHSEKKKAAINWLFFDDLEKMYPELKRSLAGRNKLGDETISYKILKRGIREGIFKKNLNLVIVDIFIHEMIKIVHAREIFPENTNSMEIIENILIPYFRGISTENGIKLMDKHFTFKKL
jgi:TetR/AcrR family transcriptional regulator, cholesterol catabolism regulator